MIEHCPFLTIGMSADDLRCTAGVNFVSVGAGRALCQVCELEDLGDTLVCPHLDVYTYYAHAQDGAHVTAQLACLVDDLPIDSRCPECPSR
ncbi:MAG: hypothetical protein IBX69_08965, partial [Anaerolineales bacterium]|nr:hypothetical protein [Anaerolineales bacterium]